MKFTRLFLAVSLALASIAPATAYDSVLPAPRIKDNGDIQLAPGFTIGRKVGNGMDLSSQLARGARRPALRSLMDRAADTFNVRDYGAIGDGASHPAQAVLGITSLAGLAGYSADGGTTKAYAFVAAYPFGKLFNLPVAAAVAVGSNALPFQIQKTSSAGTGAFGGYVYQTADVAGIVQGQAITGNACAPAGTYVELVNPTTREIRTNVVTTCGASAVALTYTHPWLARVEVGMQVSGPGIAVGSTVTAISANGVSLSSATTAALAARTLTSAATPANHSTEITFYRPFTDTEARALEMDSLGAQAAITAAYAAGGGQVTLPAGTYKLSHPLVQSVEPQNPAIPYSRSVDLVGAGIGTTFLGPVADLGPGMAALSCGDPTGTRDNDRGAYATNGSWCWGDWRGLTVQVPFSDFAYGRRPAFQSQPIFMDGLRRGARRQVVDIAARGFVYGQTLVGDHMTTQNSYFSHNWIGTRYAPPTKGLYVDILAVQTFEYDNAWAGITVAPEASIGQFTAVKPYLGFQPYAIWLEPGAPFYDRAIDQAHIDTLNAEYAGCGVIVDGNVAGQASSANAKRGMLYSKLTRPVMLRNASPDFLGGAGGVVPPGGCAFQAYIDVANLSGSSIEDLSGPSVIAPPVPGSAGMIRTRTVSYFRASEMTAGGFQLSGSGVATILERYAAACVEVINAGSLVPNGDLDKVVIEVPGVLRGHPVVLNDAPATALPRGTLLEGVGGNFGYSLYAQRAGLAGAGAAIPMGVAVQDHSACAMSGKSVVAATQSPYIYARTTTGIGAGQLLKADPANPGTATVASSLTDGTFFGVGAGTDGAATNTNARINVGP